MAECVWELSHRSIPGKGYGPENETFVRCKTHDWEAIGGAPLNAESACPIGRIEAAVEQGIKRIEAAIADGG